jgi:hypothetical protein
LLRRIAAIDHDRLHLAGAVGAAEGGGFVVFVGLEAGDALLEGRKFDHDEALEFLRPLHDLIAAATRQNLAAVFGDDGRHEIGVFLVFDRIVDLRARDPIGWHGMLRIWLDRSKTIADLSCSATRLRSPCELRRVWVRRSAERVGGKRSIQ